jgi:hypothetical protein
MVPIAPTMLAALVWHAFTDAKSPQTELLREGLKGFEPSTFCMAISRYRP